MSDEMKWTDPSRKEDASAAGEDAGEAAGTNFVMKDSPDGQNNKQENTSAGESGSAQEKEPPRYGYYQTHQEKKAGDQGQGEVPPYPGTGSAKPAKEPRKNGITAGKFGSVVALAVVFGLVAGVVFQGVNIISDHYIRKDTAEVQIAQAESLSPSSQQTEALEEDEKAAVPSTQTAAVTSGNSVADVAAVGMPSVVAITSVSMQEIPNYFGRFFGYGNIQEYPTTGSGSGIIVGENEEELLIATNKHVVTGATTISVCFMGSDVVSAEEETTKLASGNGDLDLENAVTGKVKGEASEEDLAVVSVKKSDIPDETKSQIKIAKLGDSDKLVVGEQVVAIGNALGVGQSVTSGWISALNRSITTSDGSTSESLIQTDAAINPGNSGGALLDMNGEVIGINAAKYASSSVEGMGYAIPIGTAKPILEDLMNRETRELVDEDKAAYLGVTVLNLTSEMMQIYDLPEGTFVDSVEEDGAAQKAGIKKGDVISALDGQKITGKEQLVDLLKYYEAGETVEVEIYRSDDGEYKQQILEATLGKRPKTNTDTETPSQEQSQSAGQEEVPSIDDFFNYFG